ncbi:MAG: hypothetical protein ACPGTQ_11950 [Colwellia sp.]
MKNYTKAIIASLITASVTACGGGGDSSSEPVTVTPTTPTPVELTKIKGMAIDGYIVGATIFMDLNFNGVHDDGEPSAETVEPTEDNPSWVIEIPEVHEDCGQYVPLITHVPVGAIDLDNPDTPIAEAYDLVIPPSFALRTDEDLLNVTPLTTIIWNSVEQELYAGGSELSCESIIENQQLRETIEQRLIDQEKRVAQRYNITVDSLYSDYIANGNSDLHGLARSLVPGLAKSYTETVELEQANPDAIYVFVEYYLDGTKLTPQYMSWYRREYIKLSAGNWDESIHTMRGGLNHINELLERRQQRTSITNGIEAEVAATLAEGNCTISEYFTEKSNGTGYGLANIAFANNVGWSNCLTLDRVALNISQQLITKTYYSDNKTVKTESGHYYGTDNQFRFTHMLGADANDLSGGWLSHNLSHISLSFNDDYGYDANDWYRVDNRYSSEEFWNATQEVHMHNSNDEYTVTTYHPDGTHSKRCGIWSEGESSLKDCTG